MLRLHYLRSWFESEWVRVLTFAVWRTCTSLSLWRTLALTSSFPPFINLLTRNHMVLVGRHMHPHSRCPQDFNEGHRRSHLFHVQIRVVWPFFVPPHVSSGTSFPLVCVNRNQKPGGGEGVSLLDPDLWLYGKFTCCSAPSRKLTSLLSGSWWRQGTRGAC